MCQKLLLMESIKNLKFANDHSEDSYAELVSFDRTFLALRCLLTVPVF